MSAKETNYHIYDIKTRKYEKRIINFIVEYGESKRSHMESQIIAYFLLREGQWLTQDNIRDLSLLFFEKELKKGISKGSISQILNFYEKYHVFKKRKLNDKKNAFEYSLSGPLNKITSSTIEFGVEEMDNYVSFLDSKIYSLNIYKPKNKVEESQYDILLERVKELREFIKYQKSLYENFFKTINSDKKVKESPKEITSIPPIITFMKIEREIIDFVLICPIFKFPKMKYPTIMAYFFTRKQLTQGEIMILTGLSAGKVSEGLNFLLQEGYVKLIKVKGIRKRSYELTSIAYYNYLQLYRIFKSNSDLFSNLDGISNELEANFEDLKDSYGYKILNKKVKQFLQTKPLIQNLFLLYRDALERFKEKDI